ncbi:hypothetical protein [Euzebya tangerina]|uniref:hypothetical protein n=1 Tax=Euzebya tangerina TaxID=591198 RepID=UPI000E322882|nr:hypothetical protein [Euzebya tangerina]
MTAGVPTPYLVGAAVGILVLVLWIAGLLVGAQTSDMNSVAVAEASLSPELEATLRGDAAVAQPTDSVALVPGGGGAARAVDAPAFAAIDDVALQLPVVGAGGVIFGEAPTPSALALTPVGELGRNNNPEGFVAPESFQGPEYTVRAPVTGVRPATGLATILAAPRTQLLAPVAGTVEAAITYDADGTQLTQISIRPDGRDDLFVVLRGLASTSLQPGDRVESGVTPVGVVGSGTLDDQELNPLALPAATLQVQPAVTETGAQVLTPGAAAVGDLTG